MDKQHSPGFVTLVDEARARIREIEAAALERTLADTPGARLIDVREREEYDAGHVRGAEWIGKGIIERDIETLCPDKDARLFLYCGGGYRSALASDALQRMGYTQVTSVDGGWRELQDLMPVEAPASGS